MPKKGGAATKKAFDISKLQPYKQAMQLMDQEEWKQALPMFERTMKKVPDEAKRDRIHCYCNLAQCHVHLNENLAGAEGSDRGYGGGQDVRTCVAQPRCCARRRGRATATRLPRGPLAGAPQDLRQQAGRRREAKRIDNACLLLHHQLASCLFTRTPAHCNANILGRLYTAEHGS